MNKDIYHIISDYFRGHITTADNVVLQSWLDESEENKKLLTELEQVWKITGELSFELKPDVEEEWEYFVKERNKPATSLEIIPERRITRKQFLKIAAVLIPAILVLSVGFFYLKGKPGRLAVIYTSTEKEKCILSDGTTVWINHNSTFTYPKNFRGSKREVRLEGEAFFDVAESQIPFAIVTEKTRILVVGTAFNVRAYQHENNTEVLVSRGKVIFENRSKPGEKTLLTAGERGIYSSSSEELRKETVSDYNLIGWKDDQLSFHDTPLDQIQLVLTRYFDIPVQVSPTMKKCRFTGDFQKPALDEVLNVLSVSLGASFHVKNDTVFLSGQGCSH